MELDYTLVRFEDIDLNTRQGAKLRGYFANKYRDEEIMHNHRGGDFVFSYPKVQYKVIDNTPIICGIQEGAPLAAKAALETDDIFIGDTGLPTWEKQIVRQSLRLGTAPDYIEYSFLTPWLALNQKNIDIYRAASSIQREELLKRILAGNLLSLSKGLGYSVEDTIHVWLNLREITVKFKNIDMLAFKGSFKVDFVVPDYLGLGKAVSRGFGTVRRV